MDARCANRRRRFNITHGLHACITFRRNTEMDVARHNGSHDNDDDGKECFGEKLCPSGHAMTAINRRNRGTCRRSDGHGSTARRLLQYQQQREPATRHSIVETPARTSPSLAY
ncbi:hypothetical protein CBM2599_B50425 [Cupriavidus taiwanensis]|nr:hypothetical protein CBM2600_B10567 [Cupriavidus taiwanensis]SOY96493.1 hypothetical protein CBM2599_B50425 [Cupriavidus taiwanensis]